ncbi:AAC(3)-I family aminoglycoside 3-N-acetyltransferase (plasmid) [Runella rosea]|uniref:AAC(3)-I family aminoglycoside 3-N-acetyltransferase n=1 Tax=Runella rosea TaxID=2259595 RepID=A0A344TTH9_9BACT|nr:GNAT family N-acetyltransferase [Runella rosea]AXE21950.1 AAC(3)-I family aminoglycoside 3-N-acetyltransferase [Runella rosea]
MNVEVKKLTGDEVEPFIELIHLFRDVLETDMVTKAQPEHLCRLLARSDFIVFVARFANQVIGGLTAYILPQYHSEKPVVYLYDIAVGTTYQGQGVGTKLLTQLMKYCRNLGMEELFVQADREDSQAIDFYRATGGTAIQVIQFTYLLNE